MSTQIVEEEYVCETCYKCHVKFWMPKAIQEVALLRGYHEFEFWCPNGHRQGYDLTDTDGPNDGERENDKGEVVKFPVIKGGRP